MSGYTSQEVLLQKLFSVYVPKRIKPYCISSGVLKNVYVLSGAAPYCVCSKHSKQIQQKHMLKQSE